MLGNQAETIVVGVARAEADAVLAYAADELRRRPGRVRVVHVVPAPLVDGLAAPMVVEGDTLRLAGAKVLDAAALRLEHLTSDNHVVATLLHGPTVPALVRVSSRARLIALERRDHPRPRVVTRSVSSGVAAHADGPVVVVPAGWQPSPVHEDTVVVGVADVLTAPLLLAVALDEAGSRSARLRIVHAVHYADQYDESVFGGGGGAARLAELRRNLTRELAPTLDRYPQVRSELVIELARPADLLVEESSTAGLVVVGRHRATLPCGPHLGSTVRAVLRESACPVLVVDPASAPAGSRDDAVTKVPATI
jgi:nucleotide-binding universal stress UspA family protein